MIKPRRQARSLTLWLRVASRLTLLAATLCTLAFGFEIGLRLVGAKPRTATALHAFFDRDPHAGWRGRPNAACRFATVDFDTYVVHGADGFRAATPKVVDSVVAARHSALSTRSRVVSASFTANRDQAIVRAEFEATKPAVWFVGDSMTWGWGVANGSTFVDLLAGADPERTYRNLSAPGYSALQEQLLLADLLRVETAPQMVVVVFTNNDLAENFAGSDRDPMRPRFVADGDALRLVDFPVPTKDGVNFHTWLKQRSIAYNLLHFYLLNARTAIRNVRTKGAWSAPPTLTPTHWQALERVYAAMKRDCDAHNVRLRIAFIPGPCEVTKTELWNWPEYQRDIHIKITDLTQRLGIPLLDATETFRTHFANSNAEAMTFRTDPHLSETGHRLAAEALAKLLAAP